MTMTNTPRDIEFGKPATYRITVQGVLSEASRRHFRDMTIESKQDGGDTTRTVLICHVRDQAELRGVLDALYGLHLPVIAVEQFTGNENEKRRTP